MRESTRIPLGLVQAIATILTVLGWLTLPVSLACATYWGVVSVRIAMARRSLPTCADGVSFAEQRAEWPSVAVIVPGHNEEGSIGKMIASVLASKYDGELRVIASLDRCTDGTEDEVRAIDDERVTIVTIDECPDDWAGKTHALWRAVQDTDVLETSQRLLFADADTAFEPDCVRASVALMDDRDIGLLSLLPDLSNESWYERTVQPAASFELIRQYPLDRVNRRFDDPRGKPRPFANGQFMLWRTDEYRRIGGHESVKNRLLEDIAMARLYSVHHSGNLGVLLSGGMLRCAMYDSWDAFVRGWSRIYRESVKHRPERLAKFAWRTRIFGAMLPCGALLGVIVGVAQIALNKSGGWWPLLFGALALAASLSAFATIGAQQGGRAIDAVRFPAGSWRVGTIMLDAARAARTGNAFTWAGRTYTRAVR